MKLFSTLAALAFVLVAVPAFAQEATSGGFSIFPTGVYGAYFGAALGAGIVAFGAAKGISRIGAAAVESIARQPEAQDKIFTTMLLSAALIEGVALFAVVVTMQIGGSNGYDASGDAAREAAKSAAIVQPMDIEVAAK